MPAVCVRGRVLFIPVLNDPRPAGDRLSDCLDQAGVIEILGVGDGVETREA
jgi:hypothetical protein